MLTVKLAVKQKIQGVLFSSKYLLPNKLLQILYAHQAMARGVCANHQFQYFKLIVTSNSFVRYVHISFFP